MCENIGGGKNGNNTGVENIYYVYCLRRPDKFMPEKFAPDNNYLIFYIGKGKNDRYKVHLSTYDTNSYKNNIINKIHKLCAEIICEKLYENLTEEEAFEKEKELIRFYGRIDNGTGILVNRTDGGDGASGHKHSKESKEKIRLNNIGKIRSPETRAKISINSSRRKLSVKEIENLIKINTGRKDTEEVRRKKSMSAKGKKVTEEACKNMSKAHIGKTLSDETKRKMSEAQKLAHKEGKYSSIDRRIVSSETREKISKALSGRKHSAEHIKNAAKARSINYIKRLENNNG